MPKKLQFFFLSLGIFFTIFLLVHMVFSWTEPSVLPPDNNVSAPVNISANVQWKQGELGVGYATAPYTLPTGAIGASTFYDADNKLYYVNPGGDSLLLGNLVVKGQLGIGTSSPNSTVGIDVQKGSSSSKTRGNIAAQTYLIRKSDTTTANIFGTDAGGWIDVNGSAATGYNLYINLGLSSTADILNGISFTIPGGDPGANTRMFIKANGNVGVGTLTPGQKLSVAGSLGILEGGASPSLYTVFQGGDQSAAITYTLPATSVNGCLTNNSGTLSWGACGGGGSGYATIQDEGTPLTARSILNFIGTGVNCADNSGSTRTDCTITGGTIGGSGTSPQLAYFTAGTIIASDSSLSWDSTNKRLGVGTMLKLGSSTSRPVCSIALRGLFFYWNTNNGDSLYVCMFDGNLMTYQWKLIFDLML